MAKGNVFVVRLSDEWRPHVKQIGAILDNAYESDEVVEFFKRVLPDDEVVRSYIRQKGRNKSSCSGGHMPNSRILDQPFAFFTRMRLAPRCRAN